MPVGSSRTPEGVQVPEDFDITIVSTTDDEPAIRHALEHDDFPTDEDEEGDAGDEEGDEPASDDAAADEDPAVDDAAAAPAVTGAWEEAPERETRAERDARMDRNAKRLQQSLSTLQTENAQLRERLASDGGRRGEGDAGTAGERGTVTPPPAAKFTFPTWEAYSQEHAEATHEDYLDARTDARYAFNKAQDDATAAATRAQTEAARLKQETEAHIATVKTALPDWDAVVRASKAPMTDVMHVTMLKCGALGPRIVYHLSKPENLAEAQRIAALPPIDQQIAILDLRATVKPATPTPKGKQPPSGRPVKDDAEEIVRPSSRRKGSAAPTPIKPVPGDARSTPELADLDSDAFMERMDEQDRKRGRRR